MMPGHCRDAARTTPGHCQDGGGALPERCGDAARTMPGHCQDGGATLPERCVDLDPDCHLEGAAARRSKFGCFSIRNHIRNAPFWRGPPDPARQVQIVGSGAGPRSPPGFFKICMLFQDFSSLAPGFFNFFNCFRGFSNLAPRFFNFSTFSEVFQV